MELAEFGYRETSDPKDADRRNFYRLEKWDAAELHVERLIHASNHLVCERRSSTPKRSANRVVATRYGKASASWCAGRPMRHADRCLSLRNKPDSFEPRL